MRTSETGEASGVVARDPSRRFSLLAHGGLAVLAYVPLLLTAPGRVAADTRALIYLDPGGFVPQALSLWDTSTHLGTVTHQNLGLAFPMGAWFWLTDTLGIPVWIAQRLWLGTILFAAGAGVLYLTRTLRWTGAGPLVAALVYMLSPYVLQYAPRTSVLILPWAGLPWLVAYTERAVRTGGWRYPALFALVALIVGGVNATALILVGIAPVMWLIFVIWVTREVTWRPAVGAALRIAALTVAVSVWWVVALMVQSRYGLPVLLYGETVDQVATTSTATEVLRGLGYWLFYGRDGLQPNIAAAVAYLQNPGLLTVSFLLPALGLVAAFVLRWRYRAYFAALVVVGVVIGVGTYPPGNSAPLGAAFADFAETSSAGLALRSSSRVVPLLVLGFAVLVGAATTALRIRRPRLGLVVATLIGVLAVANLPALVTGDFVDRNFERDDALPEYWEEVAEALDATDDGSRVLEIPGIQFASYRWGTTYDAPVSVGLIDRDIAAREQIPFGSAPSADLMIALDRRLQEGVFEPEVLPVAARLLSAGDVLLRSDLEFERFYAPRPRLVWSQLLGFSTPSDDDRAGGLDEPQGFGEPTENVAGPDFPLIDEQTLGLRTETDPPPVALFDVVGAPPVFHTKSTTEPVLLDGDSEGLLDAATAGLMTGEEVVLFGATLEDDPDLLALSLENDGSIVVTDTNRLRERRWRSTRGNTGFTETEDEELAHAGVGEGEAVLEVFPDASNDSRTVAIHDGASASATGYGGPQTFDPATRPVAAIDGDVTTAWQVGPLFDGVGERLVITTDEPVTTDHITLLQTQNSFGTYTIREVEVRTDGGQTFVVELGPESRTGPGQTVTFPETTFSELEIEITETGVDDPEEPEALTPVGFAEVGIPGVTFDELVRLPVNLTNSMEGSEAENTALSYVMTRLRSNPAEPLRPDEELGMSRIFEVPASRGFSLVGTARISAAIPDEQIDDLLGLPIASDPVVAARSSSRLPGSLESRARSAVDGDLDTRWTPGFLQNIGATVTVDLAEPTTFDSLDLQLVADGRHSVPTRIVVSAGGEERSVDVPAVEDRSGDNAVVAAPVEFAPLTGDSLTVQIDEVRPEITTDFFSQGPIELPVSIAELGLGLGEGVGSASLDDEFLETCRDDLLTVDGEEVPIRVTGARTTAEARGALSVEACDGALSLDGGTHELRTTFGRDSGFDLDRLVLASDVGGGAVPVTDGSLPAPTAPPPGPAIELTDEGRVSYDADVDAADSPFWLILGQSFNDGWEADAQGQGDLGAPTLVDGYANGWVMDAGGPRSVAVEWVPQKLVYAGLATSFLAALACLLLAWRGRRSDDESDDESDGVPDLVLPRTGSPALTSTLSRVLAVVGAGVVGALLVGPAWGLLLAGVTLVATTTRAGRSVLVVAAVVLVVAAFTSVVVGQIVDPHVPDFAWANQQEIGHRLALSGVLLLGVDILLDVLRHRVSSEKAVQ
ncbi:MAG: alpha-(1-_3)-arabinofuranosyltransferase [Acidimicrobiia bacterium]|nr:alpha-(1->3)-arabinofuranosyltransferase [Acidimicrobiia bacterium]